MGLGCRRRLAGEGVGGLVCGHAGFGLAAGARHAPQLVLLPSLGRDSDDFDVIASALADGGYRVLRPAPRGMAGSRGPLQDITLWDLADDVAAVIEAGLAITGTWPMRTELANRMRGMESNALATSMVLVCQCRDPNAANLTRNMFRRELRQRLPQAIK